MISLLTAVTLCFYLCASGLAPALTARADTSEMGTSETDTPETNAAVVLREGLAASADVIDLSACRLPRTALTKVFSGVLLDNPELFHVDSRLSYTYDRAGCVLTVFPVYTLSGGALAEARRFWLDTIDAFMSDLAAARSASDGLVLVGADGAVPAGAGLWGEADTVLFIHDRLAAACDYDESGTRFDALSLFRDGCGVCQAYALAFLALARAAGLEAEVVSCDEMDHAWDRVRVDGAWYHVDVTRDDPIRTAGAPSCVRHDRLLMSGAAAAARGYRDEACPAGHECTSERFSLGGLTACETALVRLGGGWYDEADGLLCRVDVGTGTAGSPGDMDGDGALSLFDLLLLEHLAPDDADASARLRLMLLEQAAGAATDVIAP